MLAVSITHAEDGRIHAFLVSGIDWRDMGPGVDGLIKALGDLRDYGDKELGVFRDLEDRDLGKRLAELRDELDEMSEAIEDDSLRTDLPVSYAVGIDLITGKFFAAHRPGDGDNAIIIQDQLDALPDAINAAEVHLSQIRPT